jgi:hypothetical protein
MLKGLIFSLNSFTVYSDLAIAVLYQEEHSAEVDTI